MSDRTIEFEFETESKGDGKLTLHEDEAKVWEEQINDQLNNGIGGLVEIHTTQPDGVQLAFIIPPKMAEYVRDKIRSVFN